MLSPLSNVLALCRRMMAKGHWITSRFDALPRQNAFCFDCNLIDVQFEECWALDSHAQDMCRQGELHMRSLESWHIIPKPASAMEACRMDSSFNILQLAFPISVASLPGCSSPGFDWCTFAPRHRTFQFHSQQRTYTLKEPSDGQQGETSLMSGHSTIGFLSAPPPITPQWVEQGSGNSPWLWMTTCSKFQSTIFTYKHTHTHIRAYLYIYIYIYILLYITKSHKDRYSSLIFITYHSYTLYLFTQCAFWSTTLCNPSCMYSCGGVGPIHKTSQGSNKNI